MKNLEPVISRMEKYFLFETATYYYLMGCDSGETAFKLLKMDRCIPQARDLSEVVCEDPNVYGKKEMTEMLQMISDGNKTTGGMTQITVAYGLVGFVRFLDCYYFTLITQRKKVGSIGFNDIYTIKSVEVFALRPREQLEFSFSNMWSAMTRKINRTTVDTAESRYMGLFQFIDLSKDFFFSYTYDLTHSLQHNYKLGGSKGYPSPPFQVLLIASRLICISSAYYAFSLLRKYLSGTATTRTS
jgi:hypothetical protein